MKSKFYMFAVFILVVVAIGIFIVKPLMSGESQSSGIVAAEDMGSYQQVVLGMKGYNYNPDTVKVSAGKPVRIYIDDSVQGCYRSIVIPQFGVSKSFFQKGDYLEFTPQTPGTYPFSCSMGMGKGKIIVE